MKITVFGASGKTGEILVNEALASGHQVCAYVRSNTSIQLVHPNLNVVVGQLNETDKLQSAMDGSDACISTLGGGSLFQHNPEVVAGIANIVQVMEALDVKRLIYMSSIGAGESRNLMPQPFRFIVADVLLRVPLADHMTNEKRIMQSKLEWTIVRPGGLTNGPVTGKIKHGTENVPMKGSQSISRSNVAHFILEQLTHTTYLNSCVWLYE
jgi:putative NADH-flavin reductase